MSITKTRPAPTTELATAQVEQSVQAFYDSYGWQKDGTGQVGEDHLFRNFRPAYRDYADGSQQRVMEAAATGGSILFAGCGDMPAGHVALAEKFNHVACIDISTQAIATARRKLARPIQAHHASILDMPIPDDSFDVVFCSHVLYHINGSDQERAVRELIRVTRPGGRVVVLYFNPGSPLHLASGVASRLSRLASRRRAPGGEQTQKLYFKAHKLSWWHRFEDAARLTIRPWEIVGSQVERLLVWSDGIARVFYRVARAVEGRAPSVAARLWMFPIVVLEKR